MDGAQNENHFRAERARGTPPDEIGLAGLPEVYMNLGTAYLRLGDAPRALEAFLYERRLAPGRPQAYSDIASAYLAQNKKEEAATVLLESFVLSQSPANLSRVAKLYGRIDDGTCAIMGHGEDRSLNHDCPVVRRDLCNAYRDLEAALRDAKLGELADSVKHRAAREPVCR